jgi:hypothetical protein
VGDSVETAYRKVARGPFDNTDVDATLALRPRVMQAIAANNADVNLVKTHWALKRIGRTEIVDPVLTRSAVYILRNPVDMVLSYARHYGLPVDKAVGAIARPSNMILADKGSTPQIIGNWSDHVNGWTRARRFPVLTIRYEDLHADPHAQFGKVLELLGVPVDPERLDKAIRFSSFKEMRRQEEEHGFVEKSKSADRFFASGRAGAGREELAPELVQQIERDHGEVMKKFGYL